MSQQELLKRAIRALDDSGIDYMVTGSVASSLHGEPRSTHDVDLVVSIDMATAKKLIGILQSPDYYLDPEVVMDAIARKGMFNLIDRETGDKVDFWILKDEPFDKSRFARKYEEELMGVRLKVSTPEDTILAKLWWANEIGGSEKQFGDALHVYEVQSDKLDQDYLASWAKKLSVGPMLRKLRQEADM